MNLLSSRRKNLKLVFLGVLLAAGPAAGLVLGPRMGLFFRDEVHSGTTVPVSFKRVVDVSPGRFVISDGFETRTVQVGQPELASTLHKGDVVSGVLESTRNGYRLQWVHLHRRRVGKHVVSLVPLLWMALWWALDRGLRDGPGCGKIRTSDPGREPG